MEFASLKAQIDAARQMEVPVDGATFRLKMPSDHAWRVVVEGNRDPAGRLLQALAFRELLNVALVGWEGVKTTHLLDGVPEEPLPFSEAARIELLDAREDIVDELVIAMAAKLKQRREQRETARKN